MKSTTAMTAVNVSIVMGKFLSCPPKKRARTTGRMKRAGKSKDSIRELLMGSTHDVGRQWAVRVRRRDPPLQTSVWGERVSGGFIFLPAEAGCSLAKASRRSRRSRRKKRSVIA